MIAAMRGKLLVVNRPGKHEGAYIFRQGFLEALMMRGRNAERVIVFRADEGKAVVSEEG
ncbi:MAG: hypothetical protein WAT74_12900 [Flavobacteriales bacterium]